MAKATWRYPSIPFTPLPLPGVLVVDNIVNFPNPDEVVPISPLPFEPNPEEPELDPEPFELNPPEPFNIDPELVNYPFDDDFEPFDVETEPYLELFEPAPVLGLMPQPAQVLALLPSNSIAAYFTVALVVALVAVVVLSSQTGMFDTSPGIQLSCHA
ncbi:hypothetical protein BGZ95_011047 [Linnemannia exigua]|uniref:Uncharacterized protein n=1 Tax=Linnemannia exigua TaxID=604196 RepID=A0AAD4H5J1_9FUNG|nr:hypothetical protein BGZ95_011047 [Linnemannia exigua]